MGAPSQLARLRCSNTLAYRFTNKRETARSLRYFHPNVSPVAWYLSSENGNVTTLHLTRRFLKKVVGPGSHPGPQNWSFGRETFVEFGLIPSWISTGWSRPFAHCFNPFLRVSSIKMQHLAIFFLKRRFCFPGSFVFICILQSLFAYLFMYFFKWSLMPQMLFSIFSWLYGLRFAINCLWSERWFFLDFLWSICKMDRKIKWKKLPLTNRNQLRPRERTETSGVWKGYVFMP